MNLLACSAPDPVRIITRNIELAAWHATAAGAILCVAIVVCLYAGRSSWWFAGAIGALLAIHPLWLMDPYRGDCGTGLARYAQFVSGICGAILILQIIWAVRRLLRSKPPIEALSKQVAANQPREVPRTLADE